ncbi:hypothetical protein LWC35_33495 [Pseudonocardia kujensis]|uniref:hypothetical protein n=1 Tax=Pseudonocardia kujensis TaxID=1128675 RepID=UPI001E5F00B9|nr:hypothetical protein [Pseudonocardia kujensis]MCE0767778.1 hypothetical protein [Pseudonocardia kujensis]
MLTAVRLGAYVGVLGVVFGAAWGAGSLARPALSPAAPAAATATATAPADAHAGMGTGEMGTGEMGTADAQGTLPDTTGLSASTDGYTLVPTTTALTTGRPTDLTFAITGPDGQAVTTYAARADGAPLRLLVVRRDGAGLQVVYPEMAPDGTWSAPVRVPTAGTWRVLADFTPVDGTPTVLGTDVSAPGDFAPLEFPPARAAQVGGYQVRIDGDLRAGAESAIFATVSLDGRAVTDLEPDRGAFGDLVALRAGDLAYNPVTAQTRAEPGDRSGPGIAFTTTVPTEGTYRLFLRFRHAGEVHTVDFTVPTTGAVATTSGGAR